MRRTFLFALTLLVGATMGVYAKKQPAKVVEPKQPKYVFYFITDGTGVNTLQLAEYYMGQCKGIMGRVPLFMNANYPVVGVSATWCTSSDVTDSAASGTALASGTKTYSGAIGVATDSVTPIYSVAKRAHDIGYVVGIGTTASVNHATPGAQFAHNKSRQNYYDIGLQVPEAGFEFYAGSRFQLERAKNTPENRKALEDNCRKAGYVVTKGLAEYEAKGKNADKVVMLQDADINSDDMPYWLDRKPGQVTIVDQLRAEIDFLYRKSQEKGCKGFYLMNEIGGIVDHACHANDGAAAAHEVLAVDSCMHIAFEFYKEHPDETLIILTADHETGGLTLGRQSGGYKIQTDVLQYQKCSISEANAHMAALAKEKGGIEKLTWEEVKNQLKADFGYWDKVKLTEEEEKRLHDFFDKTVSGDAADVRTLYMSSRAFMSEALKIMQEKACIAWTTGGHTAGLVPVIVCGVGQEMFTAHNDNAQIARNIAKILNLEK